MDTVQALNLILALVILLIVVLAGVALLIIFKMRKKEQKEEIEIQGQGNKEQISLITRKGEGIDSIYKFMEFDRIVDNMIVRKNNQQFVMVLECKGINYDLLSEEEKNAVELGFIEMLNTLRFPIQLYVQTRTLNLTDILEEYKKRTDEMRNQIDRMAGQISQAQRNGDKTAVARLQFNRQRMQNILDYGESIEGYTQDMSDRKNILQQKTYMIISYYASEYGDMSKYSKEEVVDIVFSELYTRCQTVIRALTSAEVEAKILSSEELTELLYIAYNRDEAETFRLRNALNSEYDRLYSTARDILEEKKKRIDAVIEKNAEKLAANSIIRADQITRKEKERRTRERAKQMVEEYRPQISAPLYEETQKQIDEANIEEVLSEKPQVRAIKRES